MKMTRTSLPTLPTRPLQSGKRAPYLGILMKDTAVLFSFSFPPIISPCASSFPRSRADCSRISVCYQSRSCSVRSPRWREEDHLQLTSRSPIPTSLTTQPCSKKPRRKSCFSSTNCQNGQKTTSTSYPAGGLRRIRTGIPSRVWDISTTNPAISTLISSQPCGWSCWDRGGADMQTNGIQPLIPTMPLSSFCSF